jgi:hypothetical protein
VLEHVRGDDDVEPTESVPAVERVEVGLDDFVV